MLQTSIMRHHDLVCGIILAMAVLTSSCKKTMEKEISGNWKLAADIGPHASIPQPLRPSPGHETLRLANDRYIFEMDGVLLDSGSYIIDKEGSPSLNVIHFSHDALRSYSVSIDNGMLILTLAGDPVVPWTRKYTRIF